MIDTILVLDVSGSMSGEKLRELQAAVKVFLLITSKIGLEDRIAVVTFGGSAKIASSLSTNYAKLVDTVDRFRADGSTPMAEALVMALRELANNGRILSINDIQLMPRIILMTDGEPDKEEEALVAAHLIGQAGFPIACVGVSGCKASFMEKLVRITGGMFVMARQIHDLSAFFLQQVYLTLYIARMKDQLENLLNREVLRVFLQEAMESQIDDETLDLIIAMLSSMTRRKQQESSRLIQQGRGRAARSGCCCCSIL